MVSADLQRRVNEAPGLKPIAYGIMAFAMVIVIGVFIASIALGLSIADFFENTKAVRDLASPDDATRGILSQQGTITATKAWLTPLRFIGIITFLAGISAFFFIIIESIRLRAEAMRVALPVILGTDKKSAE